MTTVTPAPNDDNHDAVSANESAWRLAAQQRDAPEPTSLASPGLVAFFLHDVEMMWNVVLGTGEVVRWCQKRDIAPMPVLLALRDERSGEKKYSVDEVAYDIVDWIWGMWIENNETACCPVPRWYIDRATGRQHYTLGPCTSFACPEHSQPKASRVLKAARGEWIGYNVIYCAVVDNLPGVVDRVRSRRRPSRRNGKSWYVARRDGPLRTLHFFATVLLPGSDPPKDWVPLMPEEAIERLARALRLPGPERVSLGWGSADGGDENDDAGNHDGGSDDESEGSAEGHESPYIALPPVQPGTRGEVLDLASEMAREKWGITPTADFFPAEVATAEEWAEVIKEAITEVRARHQRPRE